MVYYSRKLIIYLVTLVFYINEKKISESLMAPVSENIFHGSVHQLCSIAITKSWVSGETADYFFYRRCMSVESLKELVERFMCCLENLRKEMVTLLPPSIKSGLENYQKMIQTDGFKMFCPDKKAKVFQKIRFLRRLLNLNIYGWNSESYDMQGSF